VGRRAFLTLHSLPHTLTYTVQGTSTFPSTTCRSSSTKAEGEEKCDKGVVIVGRNDGWEASDVMWVWDTGCFVCAQGNGAIERWRPE